MPEAKDPAAPVRPGAGAPAEEPPGRAYLCLKAPEVRFLDAAVARLIPADELGPGAMEAGVSYFIDQQLTRAWGSHGRNYRMGPWPEGTPQQGFQSPLTPQEIYRTAIGETNACCVKRYGRSFDLLTPEQKDEVLTGLENGTIELESVSSSLFFELLLKNTVEGFFSDPVYGGNRDKIGWKLVGFPGVASATYDRLLEKFNEPYLAEPVSILDIQQGRAEVDAEGYPKHVKPRTDDA